MSALEETNIILGATEKRKIEFLGEILKKNKKLLIAFRASK